jgi:Ca2+-binding RTX toxin-like protein
MSPIDHTTRTTPPIHPALDAAPLRTRRRSRRRAVAGILSAGAVISATLFAGAAPASAATTVTVKDGVLSVISKTGKENSISVHLQAVSTNEKYYRILDLGDKLIAGAGCSKDGVAVRCFITSKLTSIQVDTKDLKDNVTAGADVFTPMSVHAGSGDDTITTGWGNDSIYGGDGTDLLTGGGGSDTIHGEQGNDQLYGHLGNDTVHGGTGGDLIAGGGGDDNLYGDSGGDNIQGNSGNDTIKGRSGHDTLTGQADDDRIDGGRGNDTLSGGSGNDRLKGEEGQDTLTGGRNKDSLLGGDGRDVLKSKDRWADRVNGGRAEDICFTDKRDTKVSCEA